MKKRIVMLFALGLTMAAPMTAFASEPETVNAEEQPICPETIDPNDIMDNYVITRFDSRNWWQYSDEDKTQFVKALINVMSRDLACPVPQNISITEIEPGLFGMFEPSSGTVTINSYHFYDGEELRNTVTHEMRHVWQYWQAKQNTEFGTDLLQRQDDYVTTYYSNCDFETIEPEVGYSLYLNEPVEADAYAYEEYRDCYYQQLDEWYISETLSVE